MLQLDAGSRLVLYSDGVTDCRDGQGTPFGAERLQQVLHRHRDAPLAQAGDALQSALHGWRGGASFEDDFTFLAVEAH
jgi:sigma-B regulation protein RsbU (phosphoserine phosphatase)